MNPTPPVHVTLKTLDDNLGEVEVSTIGELRREATTRYWRKAQLIGTEDDEQQVRLVHAGAILEHDTALANVVFTVKQPVVFVVSPATRKQELVRDDDDDNAEIFNNDAQPLPPPPPNNDDNDEEEIVCRICMSLDSPYGTQSLISPCHCRGSIGKVHLPCLNMWRAQHNNAYETCPNCGYHYRTQRTEFISFIMRDEFYTITSVLVLILISLILALTSTLLPWWFMEKVYDFVELGPFRQWMDTYHWFLQHFIFGAALVGIIGFFFHLLPILHFLRHRFDSHHMFSIIFSLSANGTPGIRVFAFCGLATSFYMTNSFIKSWTRRTVMMFGERVLSVDE